MTKTSRRSAALPHNMRRILSHAKALFLLTRLAFSPSPSPRRGTVFEHVTFPLHLTITAPDADSDAK